MDFTSICLPTALNYSISNRVQYQHPERMEITQPRVARNELPWVKPSNSLNSEGVASGFRAALFLCALFLAAAPVCAVDRLALAGPLPAQDAALESIFDGQSLKNWESPDTT